MLTTSDLAWLFSRLQLTNPQLVPLFIPQKPLAPQIFRLTCGDIDAVLKVFFHNYSEIGEEKPEDIIFDSFIGDFFYDRHVYPSRRQFLGLYKGDTYDVTLQAYIEGQPLDKQVDSCRTVRQIFPYLSHLFYAATASQLIDYLNQNPVYQSYHLLLSAKIARLDQISFIKHFINDIGRTDLDQGEKQNLLSAIASYQCDLGPSPVLIHADLKTKNIIQNGPEIIPIDWSAAHLGDPSVDLADTVVMSLNCEGVEGALNTIDRLSRFHLLKSSQADNFKIYFAYKIFSIARVWHPRYLSDACWIVNNLPVLSNRQLLEAVTWLKGLNY